MLPVAFSRAVRLLLTGALCVAGLPAAFANPPGDSPVVESSGDWLQVGIPLLAFGMTFVAKRSATSSTGSGLFAADGSINPAWNRMSGAPRHDLLLALGRTEVVTYGLKYSIDTERPNGSGQSFPSGHTAIAFSGAEFIRKQYGWGWGVPAYVTAGFVGWSRVQTRNHWTHDVLAGALIGVLSNHDLQEVRTDWGSWRVRFKVFAPEVEAPSDRSEWRGSESLSDALSDLTPGMGIEFRF
jgi:hypothetical protein